MNSREIPELRDDDSVVTLPAKCAVCDTELSVDESTMIPITEAGKPLCETHDDDATELLTVERHYGYPHNNINPQTGETGWLNDTTVWYEVTDRHKL